MESLSFISEAPSWSKLESSEAASYPCLNCYSETLTDYYSHCVLSTNRSQVLQHQSPPSNFYNFNSQNRIWLSNMQYPIQHGKIWIEKRNRENWIKNLKGVNDLLVYIYLDCRKIRDIVLDEGFAAGEDDWSSGTVSTPFIILIPKISQGEVFNPLFIDMLPWLVRLQMKLCIHKKIKEKINFKNANFKTPELRLQRKTWSSSY